MINLNYQDKQDCRVIVIDGSLDGEAYEFLEALLNETLEAGHLRVILDCELLEYINSASIAVICSAYEDFHVKNGTLVLARPSASVQKLMTITGVDKIVPISNSMDEALVCIQETKE